MLFVTVSVQVRYEIVVSPGPEMKHQSTRLPDASDSLKDTMRVCPALAWRETPQGVTMRSAVPVNRAAISRRLICEC